MAADQDEEEAESNSLADKIKKQLPILSKLIPSKKKPSKRMDDDSTDPNINIQEEEDDEEDSGKKSKKSEKKKPNKIILIVVGLGLVMLFAEDFLPKEEPVAAPVVQSPRKKSQRELDKEKAATEKVNTDTAQTEVPAATTPTEIPTVEETPSVESTVTEVAPIETPAETPTIEESVTPVIEETPVAEEKPVVEDTPVVEETPVVAEPTETPSVTETIDPNLMAPNDNASEDQIGVPGDSTVGGGDFTDKILEDLEKQAQDKEKNTPKKRDYVSPPDYEYAGRGLVYNCVGKHWACVDAPSYKTCEQNHDANKALNKKAECYPFNVYEKTKNCQSAQLMMTSSNAKTGFCSE